jgi:hypothetical protein
LISFQAKSNKKAQAIKIQNTATSSTFSTTPHTAETEIAANQSQKIVTDPKKSFEKSQTSKESHSCGQKITITVASLQKKSSKTIVEIAKESSWIVTRLSL